MYYIIIFLTLLIPASISCFIFAILASGGINQIALRRACYSLLTLILVQAFLFWVGFKVDGWINWILVQIISPAGILLLPLMGRRQKNDLISVIITVSVLTVIVMALSTYYRK